MEDGLVVYYSWLVVVWLANITDLIRGPWFYHNTLAIVFCNFMGVLSLFMILYKKGSKKNG